VPPEKVALPTKNTVVVDATLMRCIGAAKVYALPVGAPVPTIDITDAPSTLLVKLIPVEKIV
jgi:hypothetical protein